MTEFKVEIVRIGRVDKHPSADRLELTTIAAVYDDGGAIVGGYPVIFQAGTFKAGDLACYLPVDSVVPETPEFAWLWGSVPNPPPRKRRIKAKKLRGIFSMGLLHPVPEQLRGTDERNLEGLDVADTLGIVKYEDEADAEESAALAHVKRGQSKPMPWYRKLARRFLRWLGFSVKNMNAAAEYGCQAPKLKHLPGYYDIGHFRQNGSSWFNDGEEVVVMEKIHGQNASFVVDGEGELHLKSRSLWRPFNPEDPSNAWARVAQKYSLESKLGSVPGLILYGEAYGNFSDLPYGATKDDPAFAAFDIFDSAAGRWLDWDRFVAITDMLQIPRVPVLHQGAWSSALFERMPEYAEGKTTVTYTGETRGVRHVREGFVIRPAKERTIRGGQRVMLKMHGQGFLTRDDEAKAAKAKPKGKPSTKATPSKPVTLQASPELSPTARRQELKPWAVIGEAA